VKSGPVIVSPAIRYIDVVEEDRALVVEVNGSSARALFGLAVNDSSESKI
jgi:hypothetical protein